MSVFAFAFTASAAERCTFTQTLDMGIISPEVKCLQEYLNSNGFPLTADGPGAPGNETDKFGSLTQAAVIEWQQANGVSPTVGIFGPVSQAKYAELVGGATAGPITTSSEAERLLSLVDELQQQLDERQTADTDDASEPTPQVAGATTNAAAERAQTVLKSAFRMMLDAQEQVEEEADEEDREDLREDLRELSEDLFGALFEYFDGDFERAEEEADEVLDEATEVFEDAGGESARSEAEEIIEDTWELFAEIEELMDIAEDEDEDIGDASELLEEAERSLDDAEEEFENGVYRQAISDAIDAEEALERARREIDVLSNRDVERLVAAMFDELTLAEEELADAEEDNEDVEEAEEALDDAERELRRAELALDEDDYRSASRYAREAEDLIEEALETIGGSGGDREEAEEALDDAWDEYRDADDEIDDAEDDDARGADDARELLDAAKDALDDAEDALVEKDYDEVIELAEEAEDLIEEALDEL